MGTPGQPDILMSETKLDDGWNWGESASDTTPGWRSLLGAAIAIIIVLGLLYGTLLGIKALTQPGGLTRRSGGDLLRLHTSVRLGKDQMLHLVEFGQETLLIGASQAGFVLLDKMPSASARDRAQGFDQLLAETLEDVQS